MQPPMLTPVCMDRSDPPAFSKSIGGSISEVMSPADVRPEAAARSEKISITYQTLHEILQRHETLIRQRWTKTARLTEYAGIASPGLPSFRRLQQKYQRSGLFHLAVHKPRGPPDHQDAAHAAELTRSPLPFEFCSRQLRCYEYGQGQQCSWAHLSGQPYDDYKRPDREYQVTVGSSWHGAKPRCL